MKTTVFLALFGLIACQFVYAGGRACKTVAECQQGLLLLHAKLDGAHQEDPSLCKSIESCALLARSISAEIDQWNIWITTKIEPNAKISNRGIIFLEVGSHSKLGQAWRDPNGLYWSAPYGSWCAFDEARKWCLSHGTRLPTRAEVDRLRHYLGYGNTPGFEYSILFPASAPTPSRMPHQDIWSADVPKEAGHYALVGDGGSFERMEQAFTVCVSR